MNEAFSVFTLIGFPMSKTWKSASCWSLALALKWLLCESSFQIATPASTGNTSRFQDDLRTTHTRTASSQEPREPYENKTNFKTQQQTEGAGLPFPSEREAGPPLGTSTQSGRKTNPGGTENWHSVQCHCVTLSPSQALTGPNTATVWLHYILLQCPGHFKATQSHCGWKYRGICWLSPENLYVLHLSFRAP